MSFWRKLKRVVTGAPPELDDEPEAEHIDPIEALKTGLQLKEAGDIQRAVGALSYAIGHLEPSVPRTAALTERGRLALHSGRLELARTDLSAALEGPWPPMPDLLSRLYRDRGIANSLLEDHEAALADFDTSLALAGPGRGEPPTYSNRAESRVALGARSLALTDYHRARAGAEQVGADFRAYVDEKIGELEASGVTVDGDRDGDSDGDDRLARAQTLARCIDEADGQRKRGELVASVMTLQRALEIERNALVYYNLGISLCMLDQAEASIAALDAALELRPGFPAALCERGLARMNARDPEAALVDYARALTHDPAYAIAHLNSATALLSLERFGEALEHSQLAARLVLPYPDAMLVCGEARFHLGDRGRALYDFMSYLQHGGGGPYTEAAMARLQSLQAEGVEPEQPDWPEVLGWDTWLELGLDTSVEVALAAIREQGAFHVLAKLDGGKWAVAPVYHEGGLRQRWTEVADAIGERILSLPLSSFEGLWLPCIPIPVDCEPEEATELTEQSGGVTVLLDESGDAVVAIVNRRPLADVPLASQTQLFGPEAVFERHTKDRIHGRCRSCDGVFAYFEPVMDESCVLVDYRCASCGASPRHAWFEERMRPLAWSEVGFLGDDEALASVIDDDRRALEVLGVEHGALGERLDALLREAVSLYKEDIDAARTEHAAEVVEHRELAGVHAVELPLRPSLDAVVRTLRNGELPDAGAGVMWQGLQVFLAVYSGYQRCPYTTLYPPFSSSQPETPSVAVRCNDVTVLQKAHGVILTCRPGCEYRHGELDFLVLDRESGRWLRGPGLIAHLIAEHGFFEGSISLHRVEPEPLAQLLGLV